MRSNRQLDPGPRRGPVWLKIRQKDYEAAAERLKEFDSASLYNWRCDASQLVELITAEQERRLAAVEEKAADWKKDLL